jgi:hypothetical protein
MYYNVIDVRHVRDHVLWVRFEDGTAGEVDLGDELWGNVFEPLKDVDFFKKACVAEYGTVAWPNGADLAPEFLYRQVRVPA